MKKEIYIAKRKKKINFFCKLAISKKYQKNSIKSREFREGKIINMKKELIIVIIIVIAIIILDTITHNYTKINFAKINEQLEQIKEISEDIYIMEKEQDIVENTSKEGKENDNKTSKQEKLKEKIKTMEEDWKTINNKTALYIEHEELEKANVSMVKFKRYIQLEEYTEAIAELENCKYILDHIRDKEAMQIINLF